ncbi:TetR/AcrR family transcriptional regulator [Nocardia terpenica]|uniref:TetR/AcrR family transcriptional regulator n=1 Tax=Nocardia terpenica TaxID=455432 RepID=UPI001893301F|nr:TetR/AcrR family transcriptional regulator [Nocardia terpenica]MBF6061440.1 TetR/AcrR family transcriptional regulator [Nocardia terpenica]MBF6105331.1 TetR/AcrR family transcriptional regulator [Nocardia terpenica]MBF6113199.1 TetR/AcrR family transcriptional regulator [Nocardia terpenica]MBF6119329.1 TetR/AcrR family transcriptional regulator [Nocardia terpenica]MBF6152977.1 TetR/AcrR family transcriptional regulator [Nocardia terpenica]
MATASGGRGPKRRPGGRSAVVLSQVTKAVEELVAERGSENLTIPVVAERAGVQASSVYRRWGGMANLLNEVATYRLDPRRPIPETGSLRGDLEYWSREIVEHYRQPVHAELLRGGAATAGESDSDCLRNRRTEAELIAARHVDADARAVQADRIMDHVFAPLIYRLIFTPWDVDDAYAARLVRELIDPRTTH